MRLPSRRRATLYANVAIAAGLFGILARVVYHLGPRRFQAAARDVLLTSLVIAALTHALSLASRKRR